MGSAFFDSCRYLFPVYKLYLCIFKKTYGIRRKYLGHNWQHANGKNQ